MALDEIDRRMEGTTREFAPKPSRIRWKSYWRLKRQYDELRVDGGSDGTVWRAMT